MVTRRLPTIALTVLAFLSTFASLPATATHDYDQCGPGKTKLTLGTAAGVVSNDETVWFEFETERETFIQTVATNAIVGLFRWDGQQCVTICIVGASVAALAGCTMMIDPGFYLISFETWEDMPQPYVVTAGGGIPVFG